MRTYGGTTAGGLYRDADRAMLGGVCAGLAGRFGLNLRVTRFLAFIAFLMAMPIAVFSYLAAVFLLPAESHGIDVRRQESRRYRRRCRSGRTRTSREHRRAERHDEATPAGPTIEDVRERYRSLDKRLAELEKQVTSPRFQLEQEFRKL